MLHLGTSECSSVYHAIHRAALLLEVAELLQKHLKHDSIVLAAIDSHPHALLAALVRPIQALSPPLLLLHRLERFAEHPLAQRPAASRSSEDSNFVLQVSKPPPAELMQIQL